MRDAVNPDPALHLDLSDLNRGFASEHQAIKAEHFPAVEEMVMRGASPDMTARERCAVLGVYILLLFFAYLGLAGLWTVGRLCWAGVLWLMKGGL